MASVPLADPRPAPAAPSSLSVLTAVSMALVALFAAWAVADPRLIAGVPVWAKPLKFAVSFVVFFATLALVEARLSPGVRRSGLLRATTTALALSFLIEMAWMTFMAAQAQPSHYNETTMLARVMFAVMGVGALTLTAGVLVFAIAAARDAGADLGPHLRRGILLGGWLSFGLTLVTAGTMSALGTFVGTPGPGAATLPLVGWSASVGDLRPAHFLALHAMQALPLVGLWLDRRQGAGGVLTWVALAYAVATLALFAQALAGLPLIRL